MYYLWNLYDGTYLEFTSEQSLITYWKKKFGRVFEQLNITGNDKYATREYTDQYIFYDGVTFRCTRKAYYTKQYLITDENGRHIDIRTWPEHLWQAPEPKYRYTWFPNGHKRNQRRQNGPNMHHRQIYNAQDMTEDTEEVDVSENMLHKLKLRSKSVITYGDAWDKYERRSCHGYYAPRCWKDQTKTAKQYQRHDTVRSRRNRPEPEPPENYDNQPDDYENVSPLNILLCDASYD